MKIKFDLPCFLFLLLGCICLKPYAQINNPGMVNVYDSISQGKISVGAYLDVYYGYDFNKPLNSDRLYAVSSARHNEINVNLAYADFKYINESVRAHLVPGFGTYVNSNYAAEKGTLKNLIEANIGIRLSKKREIWVDAGVLPSPYSNESPISKDHLMYTRSLAAEYVPYYLGGLKMSLPLSKKVNSYLYVLNGWQTISNPNSHISLGTQIEYRPSSKLLFNWNTYLGNENSKIQPEFGNRYFTDLYAIYNPDGKFSLTSCIYYGIQEKKDSLENRSEGRWWQANIVARISINKKTSVSARLEYFEDLKSVQILPINAIPGFSCKSSSLGLNIKISKNALFRMETRYYFSKIYVFLDSQNRRSFSDLLCICNLTAWF